MFEKLADEHRKGAEAVVTEGEWKRLALGERSYRRFSGIIEVGFGALAIGAGTLALGDTSMFTSTQKGEQFAGLMFGFGIGEGILGIYLLTTEGPVESALHAYERSTGRMSVAPPTDAWLKHVHVGFVPGGATANVAMTF